MMVSFACGAKKQCLFQFFSFKQIFCQFFSSKQTRHKTTHTYTHSHVDQCETKARGRMVATCILRHLCVPERCPPLRQLRLRRALQSRVTMTVLIKTIIDNSTAPSVKTMSEIVMHELEPPSKRSSNDTFHNATESNRRTREWVHFWVSTNVSESMTSLQPQHKCLPCLANWQTWTASMKYQVSVVLWYCFHGVSVRVSVYHIFYCSVYHIFRRPEPSKKVASKHPNSECLRQNVTGCSDSLTVFNTDSTYYLCICERITEPESATNAARSASSKHCYTQKLLATEAVTHTSFYTVKLLSR